MKISLEWLSEFVDLSGLDPEFVAEKITVHTAEVEEVELRNYCTQGVMVGLVTACRALHDDERVMSLVTVNIGDRMVQTVCAAPNVREGLIGLFALPGALLSNGKRVDACELHGHSSEGVLCSAAELGLSDSHDGLVELPADHCPGTPLSQLIPERDVIIEIDNTSLTHRPDLWGQYGFARELAAVFSRELRPLAQVELDAFDHLPSVEVEVEAPVDCSYYGAMLIDVEAARPSPMWLQRRLYAVDLRPANVVVDSTNYVQFELGQPTHAFDADRIASVRVAAAPERLSFSTLDGMQRLIEKGDLLIYNGRQPVAIAGIMGGIDSAIGLDTTRLLLESANFRASRIRQTSVRLGLRTDASLRYEKKLPQVMARIAPARILEVLRRSGVAARPRSRFTSVGDDQDRPRSLTLTPGYLSERAGVAIPDQEACRILRSLGFGAEADTEGRINVQIPSFRGAFDIAIPEDISEEVMRVYGYDQITPQLPAAPIESPPVHERTRSHHRARRLLSQRYGFVELQSYGWYVESWLETLGYVPQLTLDLRNPVSADRRRMRDSLLPNLLQTVEQNRKQFDRIQAYELGRVFWLDADGVKQERDALAGILVLPAGEKNAPATAFADLRAVVDGLTVGSGMLPVSARRSSVTIAPWQMHGSHVEFIEASRGCVGEMGLLPEALARKVADGRTVAWFSLDWEACIAPAYPTRDFVSPPTFPGSMQDFTLLWPVARGYEPLRRYLDTLNHPLLQQISFVGLYQSPADPQGRYTFRFEIRAKDRTVTGAEIQSFRESLLMHLAERGIQLLT